MTVRQVLEQVLSVPIRVTEIDVEPRMIHFDELKDGTWRLIITKSLLEEEVEEEDDGEIFLSYDEMIRQMTLPIDNPI